MTKRWLLLMTLLCAGAVSAAEPAPAAASPAAAADVTVIAERKAVEEPLEWESWHANNDTANISSLQLGARNFMNYCVTCHSLKYMRYSRMASDLHISTEQLQQNLMPIEAKPADYITTTMNPADAANWFGKAPPDLSLIARARGVDYLYRFLKTFYTDGANPAASYNLAFETEAKVHATVAMPAVLSDLAGVQTPVYDASHKFVRFETTPGRMTPAEYDSFVRDTVNFLDYVGEPSQVDRRSIGIWTVLFLLLFTWLAYLLKQEYWKDVH
jgi:ubiquinol-cytochrome c reductase cytochrome c1 subunit